MSQKIITLSKQLANQIAAGEVVERPVSVVKELLENSIDAGATKIEVYIEEGGKQLIEVRDNGMGIESYELEKSLEKYSTSKIKNLDDLHHVMTFGFRGEALASISSVSDFTIYSKTAASVAGSSIHIDEDGEIVKSQRGMGEGTIVEVKRLFCNTPARLNYIKTERTEFVKIQSCIQGMVLAYPKIAFVLVHNGKQVLNFPKNSKLEDRIYSIYGEEFHDTMKKVFHEFSGIRVSGYISDPKISFQNKSRQSLYVNKRLVASPMISKAIFDAYNRFISPKTYPGHVLFLDIDPTRVDANVHPRKLEVRFADEQNVFRSIYHSIKNELERVSMVSSQNYSHHDNPRKINNDFNSGKNIGIKEASPKYYTGSGTKFKSYSPYTNTLTNPAQAGLDFNKEVLGSKGSRPTQDLSTDLHDTPIGKIIGQVHNAYIVVQTEKGLQILDQHALAERVIYEKISKQSYKPKSQQLLGGIGIHLDEKEGEVIEEYYNVFEKLGFEIDTMSHGNIMIRAIPDFMKKNNIEKIFLQILNDVTSVGSKSLDEVQNKIYAYTACRSAVKFGDKLSLFEMNALLYDASTDYSSTCPHGRPVVYDISLEELLGKYER